MSKRILTILAILCVSVFWQSPAQQTTRSPKITGPVVGQTSGAAALPMQPLGPADLVDLHVYDSPELSRSFRIDQQGNLELPLLGTPIHVAGLKPDTAARQIAAQLQAEELFVNPVVDLAVLEYRSREITVSGAVNSPTTFQELGQTRLLEAIDIAGGLAPDAGVDVVVQHSEAVATHVVLKDLLDGSHPDLDILLRGGDRISIPKVQRIYVIGQVKQPGAFPFTDAKDTTVLKVLAMSGGLDSFNRNTVYILRDQPGAAQKLQIPVPLRRIMDRQAPDVTLLANDVLYVPTNRGLKNAASVLNHVTGMTNTAVSAAIWSR
jgi:polysaccharide biosynthesis/export protein